MTQSLQDILSGRTPAEPAEIGEIKRFVREQFQADCGVTIAQKQITILVNSAALAGALRPKLGQLKSTAHIEHKLIIRII